jgi:hypothetical protein
MARSRSHKRGGAGSASVDATSDGKGVGRETTVHDAPATTDQLMSGGRKSRRRHHKKHRGGSMLATAVLPFGLFGLQKYFQKSRTNPLRRSARRLGRSARRLGRSAKRTVKRVF